MIVPSELIRSLDEAVRSDLEGLRNWYFSRLQFSTIIVAIGCILEVPEVVHEIWETAFPKHLERTVKIVSSFGLALVIGGIAGEWFFEARVSTADGLIQSFDETLIADTQRLTAEANERAASAREKADSFQSQIADSTARTKEAEAKVAAAEAESKGAAAKVATADARIADAERGAAEANAIAEKERLDEAQLELLVSPRRLTIDQQERIGKSCPRMNRAKVSVGAYGMDAEGSALAHQVAWAIFDHSFAVEYDMGGIITTAAFDEGVLISGPPESFPFINCIANALRTIGKLDGVEVNGPRHFGTAMSGNAVMGGNAAMSGGGGITPATIPPPGSPISIFIGVKPVKLLELKQQ